MSHEIELKLEILPDAATRLRERPWFNGNGCKSERQLSTYYDAAAGTLRRNGYSLRVRSAGGRVTQTLKALDHCAGLFVRGEWEHDIAGPEPDLARLAHTPAGDVDLDALQPIIRSEVNRTSCRIHDHGAEIELDLDEGAITAGSRKLAVSELEIELLSGEPRAALDFARRVAEDVPVKLGVMSKAERGFALAEGRLARPVKAEPVEVRPGMTIAQGFATIVGACVRHFRLNEALVIERRKVEGLHQARVAMRRLRSAFTLFGPAIGDEESVRIRDELRWFTGELGDARNLDVYLERELPPAERRDVEHRRDAAYETVIAAMNSKRFRHLMIDLVGWAAVGQWRGNPTAAGPLEPFVNRRMDRLWARVSGTGSLSRMNDEERHRLRIQTKKLRYAVEFVELLHLDVRERQKQFGKALEALQEELGLLNDIVVARSLTNVESWPLQNPHVGDEQERLHVRAAERELRRLRRIGPYWNA